MDYCRFYIDEIPIREVLRNEQMESNYPSKLMYLYATIWDASKWAIHEGNHKVDFNHGPFVATYKNLILKGCIFDPIQVSDDEFCSENLKAQDYAIINPLRRLKMQNFCQHFLSYSYCYDIYRYPVPPPECVIVLKEKEMFDESGKLKFGRSRRRHSKWRGRASTPMGDMMF